jgi:hypothetical protein
VGEVLAQSPLDGRSTHLMREAIRPNKYSPSSAIKRNQLDDRSTHLMREAIRPN